MSKNKPNIGVTGPDKGGLAAWWFTKLALWMQGGTAVRIQPKQGMPDVELHGLIIGGGADINPERYDESAVEEFMSTSAGKSSGFWQWIRKMARLLLFPFIFLIRKLFTTKSHRIDDKRDKLEFKLLEMALEQDWPVLGICRGAQLINIHFGGSLHRDLTSFYAEVPKVETVWPKKIVRVKKNSRLYEILEVRAVWVNALHNQAVDVLGEDIAIVGQEENGIIQAIEHSRRPFLLGVQWHPEYLPQIPSQRRIFRQLVRKGKGAKNQGDSSAGSE